MTKIVDVNERISTLKNGESFTDSTGKERTYDEMSGTLDAQFKAELGSLEKLTEEDALDSVGQMMLTDRSVDKYMTSVLLALLMETRHADFMKSIKRILKEDTKINPKWVEKITFRDDSNRNRTAYKMNTSGFLLVITRMARLKMNIKIQRDSIIYTAIKRMKIASDTVKLLHGDGVLGNEESYNMMVNEFKSIIKKKVKYTIEDKSINNLIMINTITENTFDMIIAIIEENLPIKHISTIPDLYKTCTEIRYLGISLTARYINRLVVNKDIMVMDESIVPKIKDSIIGIVKSCINDELNKTLIMLEEIHEKSVENRSTDNSARQQNIEINKTVSHLSNSALKDKIIHIKTEDIEPMLEAVMNDFDVRLIVMYPSLI